MVCLGLAGRKWPEDERAINKSISSCNSTDDREEIAGCFFVGVVTVAEPRYRKDAGLSVL